MSHPRALLVTAAVVLILLGFAGTLLASVYIARGAADHAVGVAEDQLCAVVTAVLTDPGITRNADAELLASLRQTRAEYHC